MMEKLIRKHLNPCSCGNSDLEIRFQPPLDENDMSSYFIGCKSCGIRLVKEASLALEQWNKIFKPANL